jgi:hypothetical protein
VSDHVGKESRPSHASTVATTVAPLVGKQTLTAQACPPDSAVQRKEASTDGDDTQVHRLAAHGIATPASPLPRLGTIQRLFGRHDVSAVQAHTGADATASAQSMGATAYATGNHVVLGGADLFTEAHEAAHVVQQRGGVHLKGVIGEAGDPYERHADAVAAEVVRGESAEALLDPIAGAGHVASGKVQKRDDPAGAPAALSGGAGPIDVNNPLGPMGFSSAQAMAFSADWAAVRKWVTAHRVDVTLAATIPSLVKRVRTELGKQNPSLNAVSEQTIAEYIRDASRSLGIPMAADPAAPAPDSSSGIADSLKAALAEFPSANASVTFQNGHLQAVLLGDTPTLSGSGVQVAVDTGGATLHAKDSATNSDVTIKATTDLGFSFSTKIGPCTFNAGIDPKNWQVGLSFGPGTPDVQTLPSIFTNAHAALVAAARAIASKPSADPIDNYKTAISPNLDRIKAAISAAKAISDVKPGLSVGVSASGPPESTPAAGPAPMPCSIQAKITFTF